MNDLLSIFLRHGLSSSGIPTEVALDGACSEAPASPGASVACYSRTKNIFVVPIVESKNKLVQIQRQIFSAHAVIRANNATFQQRPERFNAVRMDRTSNVLAFHMRHGRMRKACINQLPIPAMIVSRNQSDLAIYGHPYKVVKRSHIGNLDELANNITLASNRANDCHFVRSASDAFALVAMPVFVFAADIGFINFDNAHKLDELRISKASAKSMAHVPRRFVRPDFRAKFCAQCSVDLKRRHALFARQHEIEHFEPSQHAYICILEHGADQERKAVVLVIRMLLADPMKWPRPKCVNFVRSTTRTVHTIRPSASLQIPHTGIVIRKQFVKFGNRHLPGKFEVCFRHAEEYTPTLERCQVRDSPLFKEGNMLACNSFTASDRSGSLVTPQRCRQ